MQRIADEVRRQGITIGLVPTMGFLHEGHLSLIRRSKAEAQLTVVSIFVNPLQFGPHEDFDRYPRAFEHDIGLVEQTGGDVVFAPGYEEMYPQGFTTFVEVQKLTEGLCGASRPGHFRGVTTVVTKLFCTVKPHIAVFGQKDAQQAVVIRRMVQDLNLDTKIIVCPTVREEDGLAMSSRNTSLSPVERNDATVLYASLRLAEEMIGQGTRDAQQIVAVIRHLILSKPSAKVDYVAVVDRYALEPLSEIQDGAMILLAVWIGHIRLIDNIVIKL
ncbi:MAG: pantoate--beta-alanine ligase [Candidatus Latescibacteria bacterium]|nr:pantoate--beta-alanine ligase [Candidatus Latescibacterota bacterium]